MKMAIVMKDMLLRIAKITNVRLTDIRILGYNISGMTFFRFHGFITHTPLHILGNPDYFDGTQCSPWRRSAIAVNE